MQLSVWKQTKVSQYIWIHPYCFYFSQSQPCYTKLHLKTEFISSDICNLPAHCFLHIICITFSILQLSDMLTYFTLHCQSHNPSHNLLISSHRERMGAACSLSRTL